MAADPELIALIAGAGAMIEKALDRLGAGEQPRLLSVGEAAKRYRVDRRTVLSWCEDIPGALVPIGRRRTYIDIAALEMSGRVRS